MTEKTIKAIETALARGERLELSLDKDGNVKIRTVRRKELKV